MIEKTAIMMREDQKEKKDVRHELGTQPLLNLGSVRAIFFKQ